MAVRRREFLGLCGTFLARACVPGALTSCSYGDSDDHGFGRFPLGVASGDPRPTSVVLWTRVKPAGLGVPAVVRVEMALDPGFSTGVLQQSYEVTSASDYTLRVIVEDLEPDTIYYYRFSVDRQRSATGRTWTAPHATAAEPIRFAFVSCQDRRHGFYGAYRRMLNDDMNAPAAEQLRFVLHLGDFIYETLNDPLQAPIDDAREPMSAGLVDALGRPRHVAAFPDGGETASGLRYARTVDDYRHLYREFLQDKDLQAARARWPFIHIWDDHEFSDDCWQTEANYQDAGPGSSTDEPSQPRKVAANQAWFEYMPVNLARLDDVDADLRHSHEFSYASVQPSPNRVVDESNFASNPDNLLALDTLTIYRSFRFGSWLELLATDNRSYRSDHAVPEDISGNLSAFVHPRTVMPLDLVNELDAGRTANGGDPNDFVLDPAPLFNPRIDSPPGTILGSRQKAWWQTTLERSEARWKVWANSVPLLRAMINASELGIGLPDLLLSADTWDGYATERNELMRFLLDHDIRNVVSLSGDVHAHFAGRVFDDFDAQRQDPGAPAPTPVVVELVCAAVSSVSMFTAAERLSRQEPADATLRSLISYDAREAAMFADDAFVNNLNNTILNGVTAGQIAAMTNSETDIRAAANPNVNNHLAFVDTDAHGYGIAVVGESVLSVDLISVDGYNRDHGTEGPPIACMTSFTVPWTAPGATASIDGPAFTGTPPFPFLESAT
jgi:alkaline phosphatase D